LTSAQGIASTTKRGAPLGNPEITILRYHYRTQSPLDVQRCLSALGFEPIGSTADYFAKYISDEMAKYGKIIREANIKAE
jgi:hypothetical protein